MKDTQKLVRKVSRLCWDIEELSEEFCEGSFDGAVWSQLERIEKQFINIQRYLGKMDLVLEKAFDCLEKEKDKQQRMTK